MDNKKKDAMYPVFDNGNLRITISRGNGKLGNIPGFNILPGNEPIRNKKGIPLTNIKGTCGKHCACCLKQCYAVKYMQFHHNTTVKNYAINTYIMRNDPEKLIAQIKEYCAKNIVKYFRFHTAGEIESLDQLNTYAKICREIPDVIFYIYTKSFDILETWFKTINEIPENFIINLSEWHGNLDFIHQTNCSKLFKECNVFYYDDEESSNEVHFMAHCPAIDSEGHETGVTCAQCRACMYKGTRIAVYAH